jgi:hypothetical protein
MEETVNRRAFLAATAAAATVTTLKGAAAVTESPFGRDCAIELGAGDPPATVLAGNQASFPIDGVAI